MVTFVERNFARYSDPEKLKKKYATDPLHVNARVAYLISQVSKLNVEAPARERFFKVIQEAGLFSLHSFANQGLLVMRSLLKAIGAKDSQTACLLIQNGFALVTHADLKGAMQENLPEVARAIVRGPHRWLTPKIISDVFFWACEKHHTELALELIVNGLDYAAYEPLLAASSEGLTEVVYALLTAGNVSESINYCLFETCAQGHLETVKMLVEFGGDPDYVRNSDEMTCVMFASDHEGVLSFLLTKLKNKALINKVDLEGKTAFSMALSEGKSSCAHLLLEAGCDVSIPKGRRSTLQMAAEKGMFDILVKIGERTSTEQRALESGLALCLACANGHLSCAKQLWAWGADVTFTDEQGATPLHYVAQHNWFRFINPLLQKVPVVRRLAYVNATNKAGQTPLQIAHGEESVRVLINAGADPRLKKTEKTPESADKRVEETLFPSALHVLLQDGVEDPKSLEAIVTLCAQLPYLDFAKQDARFAYILTKILLLNGREDLADPLIPLVSVLPMTDMRFYLNRPRYSQLACKVHGKTFYLNITLLNQRFGFFQLNTNFANKNEVDLSTLIREEDVGSFEDMLNFLYSGYKKAVMIDHDRFKGLARVADAFSCDPLKQELEAWLLQHPECANWNALLKILQFPRESKRKELL